MTRQNKYEVPIEQINTVMQLIQLHTVPCYAHNSSNFK